ncbi:MAG: glycerophosphodiester phosphodiesterase [Alphaproteobacteria bacterium]|nr:glycerophosphodiester phosphodiesterase [Alphaproteobacteria bacterium]
MRLFVRLLAAFGFFVVAVLLFNASWFAAPNPEAKLRLIAHRGVHQTFSRENLTNDTCTAERIHPPRHDFLENTVASAQAAFDSGADIVEFDIAPTRDGRVAIFHDWTIDCRTEGTGATRDFSLAELQALDIGYGYTADGGITFPFRGRNIGPMPELADMLDGAKGGRFLVNFKSNDPGEADMLAARLAERPDWRVRIWSAYGGQPPSDHINALVPGLQAYGAPAAKTCLIDYLLYGWTGYVPPACRDTKIIVPANYAPLLWGWPHRFGERMRAVGSEIILLGPMALSDAGTAGIDSIEELNLIPAHFDGYVWTNRIEVIGPALGRGMAPAGIDG